MDTVRLLISCPDAKGIIAAVARFVSEHGGNILDADQHSDKQHGEFFMRVEIERQGFNLDHASFESAWSPVAERFAMRWRVSWSGEIKRMAIFVSKAGHCLNDLLWRWKTGELHVEIPFVLSNHEALRDDVEALGIPFKYLPVMPETRAQQEAEARRLCEGPDSTIPECRGEPATAKPELCGSPVAPLTSAHGRSQGPSAVFGQAATAKSKRRGPSVAQPPSAVREQAGLQLEQGHHRPPVDFIVLARYMQILSPAFVAAWPARIINIHHSFLPAFAGARPYHQAYDRGVKIIGATSHYVTDTLDDGPIIAQEAMSVDHRDTVDDLIRKGRDLERVVLAQAVRLHVEDKILVSQNKTVVFD